MVLSMVKINVFGKHIFQTFLNRDSRDKFGVQAGWLSHRRRGDVVISQIASELKLRKLRLKLDRI